MRLADMTEKYVIQIIRKTDEYKEWYHQSFATIPEVKAYMDAHLCLICYRVVCELVPSHWIWVNREIGFREPLDECA